MFRPVLRVQSVSILSVVRNTGEPRTDDKPRVEWVAGKYLVLWILSMWEIPARQRIMIYLGSGGQ
jgi:hypothetical protein